jgi:ectoine hydroxylase-related dioxygenase (phytanoyl-CoA dioxygenase family)
MSSNVEPDGFSIVPGVLSGPQMELLRAEIGDIDEGAGRRGLLTVPAVSAFARSEKALALVNPWLCGKAHPVRAIFFDKTPNANWLVPWHQDLTIALAEAAEVPCFGPWSVKDGTPHVQPPAELLEQMLTLRLHLDDATESNGALRVIPRSHRSGRLSAEDIREWRAQKPEVVCGAEAGDVLLMRPLLLHASGRSAAACHRRVLHIDYAGFTLPGNLRWPGAA